MKVLVLLTIIFSSLLLPVVAYAQTGTCRNGPDGFVDWKKCLEGTTAPNTTPVKINTPVFINNAYQKFYEDSYSNGKCFNKVLETTNPDGSKSYLGQYLTEANECATRMVLNKMALDVFSIILGVMFLIFCFLIFRSRIMYITSGDNEEQTKKSKKMATAAFIGFLMIFLGIIIGQILALSIGSNLWEIKLFG